MLVLIFLFGCWLINTNNNRKFTLFFDFFPFFRNANRQRKPKKRMVKNLIGFGSILFIGFALRIRFGEGKMYIGLSLKRDLGLSSWSYKRKVIKRENCKYLPYDNIQIFSATVNFL